MTKPMTLEELKEKLDDIMLEASIKGFNRRATFGDISSRDKTLQAFIQFREENHIVQVVEGELPVPYIPVDAKGNLNMDFALGAKRQREAIKEAGYVKVRSVSEVMK